MSPRIRNLLLTSTALLSLGSIPGAAGPEGGVVVGGSATIRGQGTSSVIVNQSSQRAIVNWHTFNIGTGESTRFNQPNSSAITLNRVTGGMGPSTINGILSANGRVFVINRDGMLIGRNARINTAGFVASTSDIADSDFMAGRYNFNRPGRPDASIVNLGSVTASSHGFAALVAPGVRNSGTITATLGTVALASGNTFTLDMYGDKLIQVGVSDQIASQVIDVATGKPLKSLVSNDGTLRANGGRVELTAVAARHIVDSVINTKGVIEANSVGLRGGKIVLGGATGSTKTKGSPKQTIKIAGKLNAKGTDKGSKGGTIQVTGEDIRFAAAMIDVSGHSGGGKVLVGGDWAGGKPGYTVDNKAARLEDHVIPTATNLTVDSATSINASATHRGDGGKVILWSDVQTTFAGTILARGGDLGGDGGFVEVSGKQLAFTGNVDTRAPHGRVGTLLLDPLDYYVDPEGGPNRGNASVITSVALQGQLTTTSVVIQTNGSGPQDGDIFVTAPVTWNAPTTLTLDAHRNIDIGAAITASNNDGGLTLRARGDITATAAVNVGRFILDEGSWRQVTSSLPAFSARDFRIIGGSFKRARAGGAEETYEIVDVYGLQGIGSSSYLLSQSYKLVNDIDASGTVHWNDGKGFKPIGSGGYYNEFSGSLNGQNFVVKGLNINRGDAQHVGLFGYIGYSGSVSNLGIVNANVASTYSDNHGSVGILAGYHAAVDTISNVYTTGVVTGVTASSGLSVRIGGLVGSNHGSINNSYSSASVNAVGIDSSPNVGGLVGYNTGTIRWSYSTGDVNTDVAMTNAATGGAVGLNHGGTLNQVYASGFVNASVVPGSFVGGLVGKTTGEVTVVNSYWDKGTTGQQHSAGGTGLTTAQARQQASYVGFDFTGESPRWFMLDGQTRPFLRSEWSQRITNAHQLQLVAMNPSASYTLANNIDLGPTLANPSEMWGPAGFASIAQGTGSDIFTGSLDGQGFTIANLTNSAASPGGLFGVIGAAGTVQNLTLTNVTINATANGQSIGPVAGSNDGTIQNVHVRSGTVNGGSFSNIVAGGLVGTNTSNTTISQSSSFANVTVGNAPGGFVGQNFAGGLVGINIGTITQSFASGNVVGGDHSNVGGLVGMNGLPLGKPGTISSSYAMGSVAGRIAGGLVGLNASGTIVTSFSTGRVHDGFSSGGLVGDNFGTVTNSFWDTETSGQTTSAGGTGRTTAQLQAALASGWGANGWAIVNGVSYPYLQWQVPNGTPQVVSGVAYSDRGVTPLVGARINGLVNGSDEGSLLTGGGTHTGANGYYYFLLAPGTIAAANAQVIGGAFVGGNLVGAVAYHNAPQSLANLNIYGGYLRTNTNAATLSQVVALDAIALGNHGNLATAIAALPGRELHARGATFDFNVAINFPGTRIHSTDGVMTQSAPINVANLLLLGGGSHKLDHPNNQIGTLAANTGSVKVTDNGGLMIGTVAGSSGVTVDTLVLSSAGAVGQTAPITVSNLALLGAGGNYLLNHSANDIGTLATNTGSVRVTDNGGLNIGTLAGTVGVTADTVVLSSTGTVTQSAPITAASLALLGSGGSYMLNNSANDIGTLAANTSVINVTSNGGLAFGAVAGTVGVTADTLVVSSTGAVTQTAPITVGNLALLGAGGTFTLSDAGNSIGTLATNTGSVKVTDNGGLMIGTVAGSSGVTADTLVLSSAGAVGQTAPITVSNLSLLGTGGNYVLNNVDNAIGTFAANTGSVRLTDGGGLTIGTVAGTVGVTADTLVLSNNATVSQTAPITAANLALVGPGGSYVLTNTDNQIGTFAAHTGSVSLVDNGDINIGTVAGVNGVTLTGALTMQQIGSTITASDPVNVGLFNLVAGNWVQNAATLPGFAAADFRIGVNASFLRVTGGDGSASAPYKIADVYGLQGINNQGFLAKSFVLANDIDASGTANWNSGKGFVPIAAVGGPFVGTLDGKSHTISGLVIAPNDATTQSIGLFGTIGNGAVVSDLSLANATVSANPGFDSSQFSQWVGVLAGTSGGTVTNVHATGAVNGGSMVGVIAGGLVGQHGILGPTNHAGRIEHSTANVVVSVGSGTPTNNDGTCSNCMFNAAGGLVGANVAGSTIANSSAAGDVSAGGSAFAGGLVGYNGFTVPASAHGIIENSFASGNVTVTGLSSAAGGLVGINAFGSVVTNSQAFGTVTASVNATNPNRSATAGGLVGQNDGLITSTTVPSRPSDDDATPQSSCGQGASYSCASGSVHVGALGVGGGLAGSNSGNILKSFATGAVTGSSGLALDATTVLGGLVGNNRGTVSQSFATGNVGGENKNFLIAGGLVADNSGIISNSLAAGNVIAGDNSMAGGLVATNNAGHEEGSGGVGLQHSANAEINNSIATGNVSVGALSIAGGLVAANGGTLASVQASGAVTAGHDSIIGGLVGILGEGQITGSSAASGNVTGLGANMIVGGLVGANFGTISGITGTGSVEGANNSMIGGLVGLNAGSVANSRTTAAVSVAGGNMSFIGGLIGLNLGKVDQSTAAAAVTGGAISAVGGLVGANVSLADGTRSLPSIPSGLIPGSTFPNGTITASSASGNVSGGATSHVGGLVGANGGSISGSNASGDVEGGIASNVGGLVGMNSGPVTTMALPSVVSSGCDGQACQAIIDGSISTGPGSIASSQASGNVSGAGLLGGLVGINPGTITNSSASGDVTSSAVASIIGGLVGTNMGSIADSSASGDVRSSGGAAFVGGFVGVNNARITNSNATGAVSGANAAAIGGFSGTNIEGSISQSSAKGNVTSTGTSVAVGGFVGVNMATISLSYANGDVRVGDGGFAGGFVGLNFGSINQAYAIGAVTGGDGSFLGGFVGLNVGGQFAAPAPAGSLPPTPLSLPGSITQAYALGPVTGGNNAVAAAFAALNLGKLDQVYGAGRVRGGTGATLAGLVGLNQFGGNLPGGLPFPINLPTGSATNSYWDMQTTGQLTSAGGKGLNTAELANGLPTGFDPAIWRHGSYPQLVNLGTQQNTTPGPAVIPPVDRNPDPPPPTEHRPDLPPPNEQVTPPVTVNVNPTVPNPVVDPQQVLAQTQQTPSPGQQQPQLEPRQQPQWIATGPGGITAPQPTRLDVGAGRYFYLPPANEARLIADEVVLHLPCDVAQATLNDILTRHQLTVVGSQCLTGGQATYRMRFTSNQNIAGVIKALAQHQIIASAQANYTYSLMQPAVASIDSGQGDAGQYVPEKLRLSEIHRTLRGNNVSIGVIDSEIDSAHPDLKGTVSERYDATGVEDSPHAHGTGMAGAIVSRQRLLGVAPGARILAVRAFSTRSKSPESTTYNILRGLDWAINNKVRIVNMSFAGPRDPSLERALKEAHDKGIILIAAAGNAGPKSPPLYPAADRHVIAVTATDIDDRLFTGANRGNYLTLSAPGVDILVPAPNGEYQITTGTSVATAHISGVVALMLERNPRLTPADVRRILTQSAKRIGPSGEYGSGLVDPIRALELAAPRSAAAPAPRR